MGTAHIYFPSLFLQTEDLVVLEIASLTQPTAASIQNSQTPGRHNRVFGKKLKKKKRRKKGRGKKKSCPCLQPLNSDQGNYCRICFPSSKQIEHVAFFKRQRSSKWRAALRRPTVTLWKGVLSVCVLLRHARKHIFKDCIH